MLEECIRNCPVKKWNGIIGKIALEAISPVYIDDVQIYPDVKNRKARVKITVKNSTPNNF